MAPDSDEDFTAHSVIQVHGLTWGQLRGKLQLHHRRSDLAADRQLQLHPR